ncbi:MAG TPA: endo-1,4-beta-xylanase [Acidobacteriaceae bacterium]
MQRGIEMNAELKSRREFLKGATVVVAAGGLAAVLPQGYAQESAQGNGGEAAHGAFTGPDSLRAHATARGMLVGCAVVPELLANNAQYASLVAEQASILVPENALKWAALRPSPDQFDFKGADAILDFAAAHDQKVRGHNLCWHEALPAWFASTVTKDNAAHFLTEHITTVAGRYAGKLQAWDVVNEAIDPKNGRADALRKSPWLEMIGPDYIDLAFRTARKADATALLTYNDYGIELDTPEHTAKREAVMALVQAMKKRHVPIDAVGVQSHLDAEAGMPGAGLQKFVRELGHMGLQVFITELDVNDRKLTGSMAERDAAVAKMYRDYLTMMLAEKNVNVALTWGITDRYTWLRGPRYGRSDGQPNRPLPFDADDQPTPAFYAERAAIDSHKHRT